MGKLVVTECAMHSYYEKGDVAYAVIDKGHIVVDGSIEMVYSTSDSADRVVVEGNVEHAHASSKTNADNLNLATEEEKVTWDYDGEPETTHAKNKLDSTTGEYVYDPTVAGETLIQNAKDFENSDKSVIATKGSTVIECSLSEFRDRVNGLNGFDPETFEGYNVVLACNVVLKDDNWIPIGTNDNPFKGVFDGQNYSVTGLKFSGTVSGSQVGLFGLVSGTHNDSYAAISDVWSDDTFTETNISENKYTAVIKNLTIVNAEIANTGSSSSNRYTGVAVGEALNAYLCNITVSGSVSGVKGIGGIVGSLDSSVAKDCTNNANVTASIYNAGGIAGGVNYCKKIGNKKDRNAIINCINNGKISLASGIEGTETGNAAGIFAICQMSTSSDGSTLIYDCTNNGEIHTDNTAAAMGGIIASAWCSGAVVNCINNGNITTTNTVKNVAGIAARAIYKIYNCTNTANITANANYLSGISIWYTGMGGSVNDTAFTNCSNSGILENTNTDAGAETYQLYAETNKAIFSDKTYANVDELNAEISGAGSVRTIVFENCVVADTTGTIKLTSTISYISSDKKIADSIDAISGSNNLTVDIPNLNVIVDNDFNGNLSFVGKENNITVNKDKIVSKISISGDGSSLTNNGTIKSVALAGKNTVVATNNGTIGLFGFSGTGIYTLTNNGTISYQQAENHNVCNIHTVSTITACTITINNYGTIAARKNSNGSSNYAILFYNNCDVTLNCYSSSSIVAEGTYFLACGSAKSVTFNVHDGATFSKDGKTFTLSAYSNVSVNKVTD